MEWISVKDELPKEGVQVLVCSMHENGSKEPSIAMLDRFDPSYSNTITWYIKGAPWRGGNWDKEPDRSSISHWMPLPKPPPQQR